MMKNAELFYIFFWPGLLIFLMVILTIFCIQRSWREFHPFADFIDFFRFGKQEKKYWDCNPAHRSVILLVIHFFVTIVRMFSPVQYFKILYKWKQKKKGEGKVHFPSWIGEIYVLIWFVYDLVILIRYEHIDAIYIKPLIFVLMFQLVQVVYSCLYYNFLRSAFKIQANPHNFHRSIILIIINYLDVTIIYAIVYLNIISHLKVPDVNNWGSFSSLYYSFVTITTLGYGDVYPLDFIGRFATVTEVLIGILITVIALARIVGSIGGGKDLVNSG